MLRCAEERGHGESVRNKSEIKTKQTMWLTLPFCHRGYGFVSFRISDGAAFTYRICRVALRWSWTLSGAGSGLEMPFANDTLARFSFVCTVRQLGNVQVPVVFVSGKIRADIKSAPRSKYRRRRLEVCSLVRYSSRVCALKH